MMDEIGGFEIVVINNTTNAENSINLAGKSISSHTVELEKGNTYFFAISTYDIEGMYSNPTDPIELRID